MASRNGKAMRFSETQLRSQGRATRGVRGMSLKKGDVVVGVVAADNEETLLTICESGYGKRTKMSEYTRKNRGGQGLINIQTTKRNGKVVAVLDVRAEDEIMIMTEAGMVIRTSVRGIRTLSRNTQGVTLIKLNDSDKVTAVAKVVEEDDAAQGDAPADVESGEEVETEEGEGDTAADGDAQAEDAE